MGLQTRFQRPSEEYGFMATPAKRVTHPKDFSVAYDEHVDVLHVRLGEPVAYEGDGLPDGIELDYSLEDGCPRGAKVPGFARLPWRRRLKELADILGEHLGVNPNDLALAIATATRRKKS